MFRRPICSRPTRPTRLRWRRSPRRPRSSPPRSVPTRFYGEPLVAACAAAGTDYVDLTGEPEFVDRMWLGYHEQAQRSGARLVHCCGFDSIPHDLGAYFTVKQLPEGVPLTVNGYVRVEGQFSGGTFHSAINALRPGATDGDRRPAAPPGRATAGRPRGSTRRPPGYAATPSWAAGRCRSRPSTARSSAAPRPRSSATGRTSATATTSSPSTCPSVVPVTAGGVGGGSCWRRCRRLASSCSRRDRPARGRARQVRAKSWFKVTFVGEGGGKRVVTEVCRRRPRLRRDRQDARRVGPLPRLRRAARDRGPGHHRARRWATPCSRACSGRE